MQQQRYVYVGYTINEKKVGLTESIGTKRDVEVDSTQDSKLRIAKMLHSRWNKFF